ncbi:hypothetical protein [Mesorhizobium sp. KR9-304]|uniref:hypothetical protein n=1 Tax=Mesorhizobium sp. KR9-304 TaxID=3156614 RepID=UPI0032B34456
MSKAFRGAASAAQTLAGNANRRGDHVVAHQAHVISRLAQGLARLQAGFDQQAQQLTLGLIRLQRHLKSSGGGGGGKRRPKFRPRGPGGELPGYFVDITGRGGGKQGKRSGSQKSKWPRAADAGLVGRRIGRGPVRMTGSGADAQSAKAVTAAFAKLLAAQAQLLQMRSDVEGLKKARR